jgi:hypothetical protein
MPDPIQARVLLHGMIQGAQAGAISAGFGVTIDCGRLCFSAMIAARSLAQLCAAVVSPR